MRKPTRPREVGRGERVLPGVWRLRLPLPWPGVPHCNAWAIAAGDGIVLVDTGTHEPGSLGQLERALDQVGLRLEHVRLLVCTHAHADHCGQAAPIIERAGCELWANPNLDHFNAQADDPEAAHARRVEIARQSGVPANPPDRGRPLAAGPLRPDRDLVPGVEVETDLGAWSVHSTPGHAPSHVCLFQPERRLLISGDHLLGRVSLYFDYGLSPDPVGEFLGLARRHRRAGRPARAERPRPPVLRRPRAPRGQPRARPQASRRGPRRARRRPEHRLRPAPRGLRREAHPGDHRLAADQGPLLPDAPRGHRRRAAHRGGAGTVGG